MVKFTVDRQDAEVMALGAKHIVQQCEALLDRVAKVYAGHYHRETLAGYLIGARSLADLARWALSGDANRLSAEDAEQAKQAEVRA